LIKYIYLLAGGALGTWLRYAMSGWAYQVFGWTFPIGTLVVNAAGSFAIGLLWGLAENTAFSPNMRVFLFTGLLGGYTTFSTYMLESMNLLRDGETRLALINLVGSNVLGIILVFAGYFLVRYLPDLLK
jgi:fluoride exporter